MTIENKFISTYKYNLIDAGSVTDSCPSNIALIKYWGKFANQIPANASLSFTLSKCFTETTVEFTKSENFSVQVFLSEKENVAFANKIKKYLPSIQPYLPFITQYSFLIKTQNTFPHSSGIASSASGYGALAKCLLKMEKLLIDSPKMDMQKASFLARLGSGSACRSMYDGLVVWGETSLIKGSSNLFANPYPYIIHKEFMGFCDSIILIHEGEKKVSSTVGHNLMQNHPFAHQRFTQAQENIKKIIPILKTGNLIEFGTIIESEALTLHAMMMTSNPYFILMQPNTLATINKILEFRNETQLPIFFTLDAGANIHILYPKSIEIKAKEFINNEILAFSDSKKVIHDNIRI